MTLLFPSSSDFPDSPFPGYYLPRCVKPIMRLLDLLARTGPQPRGVVETNLAQQAGQLLALVARNADKVELAGYTLRPTSRGRALLESEQQLLRTVPWLADGALTANQRLVLYVAACSTSRRAVDVAKAVGIPSSVVSTCEFLARDESGLITLTSECARQAQDFCGRIATLPAFESPAPESPTT
jgi:hypothetical protein